MEKETRKLQPIKWHQGAFHKRSSICEAPGQDKFHFVSSHCAFKFPQIYNMKKRMVRFQTLSAFHQQKESLASHLPMQKALTILHSTFPCPRLCWEQGRSRNSGVSIRTSGERPPSPWNQVWVALEFAYRSYPPLISGARGLLGQCLHQRGVRMRRVVSVCTALLKQRALANKHMADVVAGVCCTAFLWHHLCCLPCTSLGLINIPHLLCNVFSPCKATYLLLACKLHTCQSG